MEIPTYVVLNKAVGATPLQCMEAWRAAQPAAFADIPLTYAGRLDPMASGKLIVLIGEECKKKDEYLALDKTYEFSVLFGIGSDTHDVLGRLTTDTSPRAGELSSGALRGASPSLTPSQSSPALETHQAKSQLVTLKGKTRPSGPEHPEQRLGSLKSRLATICINLTGEIELPYPHFSSKTVAGKPLHMWTLEGRLAEIAIPTKQSTIYSLQLDGIETQSRAEICDQARAKIDTIAPVTDERKSLGNDFRRVDVRADWEQIKSDDSLPSEYHIAHFTCTASSGTYMRTLAKLIGEQLNPPLLSLAWSIHRTNIDF